MLIHSCFFINLFSPAVQCLFELCLITQKKIVSFRLNLVKDQAPLRPYDVNIIVNPPPVHQIDWFIDLCPSCRKLLFVQTHFCDRSQLFSSCDSKQCEISGESKTSEIPWTCWWTFPLPWIHRSSVSQKSKIQIQTLLEKIWLTASAICDIGISHDIRSFMSRHMVYAAA